MEVVNKLMERPLTQLTLTQMEKGARSRAYNNHFMIYGLQRQIWTSKGEICGWWGTILWIDQPTQRPIELLAAAKQRAKHPESLKSRKSWRWTLSHQAELRGDHTEAKTQTLVWDQAFPDPAELSGRVCVCVCVCVCVDPAILRRLAVKSQSSLQYRLWMPRMRVCGAESHVVVLRLWRELSLSHGARVWWPGWARLRDFKGIHTADTCQYTHIYTGCCTCK